MRTPMLHLLACAVIGVVPAHAENWPGWRGPAGGVSAESALPVNWARDKNIRWSVEIPGEGASSPIVWENRVFVTSSLEKGRRRLVHCLDRSTGKTLWTRATLDDNAERTSSVTGHAAATPTTDGKRVVAAFGNAGVVCFDFDGKPLWHAKLGDFDTELGLASSPVLFKDLVLLVCDHDGDRFKSFDSFLVGLDAATGKVRWKTERPGLGRSWSTPILVPVGDRKELVVAGQDRVRAYDPETGKQLWLAAGTTGWVAPSPVFGHGLVFVTSGKNGPVLAVRPGGSGDATIDRVVWKHDSGGPYVCSPLLYGDELYIHDEAGILSCFDARTGKRHYRQRLPAGKFTASAVAGAGHVYLVNENGTTFVIKAGPAFELVATNALDEYCAASPAVSGGEMFLRTERRLWCISK